ncbi:hypothetical protein JCM3775_001789 [Rhodotorula graminis]
MSPPTALDLDAEQSVASPSITVDSPVLPDAPADSPLSTAHDGPSPSRSATLSGMPTSRTTSARSASARTRSRSPAPATTQSLSALSSPAAAASSPLGSPHVPVSSSAHAAANPQAALSRPSPVVPSSPSVPPTPSFSRPTSPRPSAGARGLAGDEPVSPTRTRNSSSALGGGGPDAGLSSPSAPAAQDGTMLSTSGSQVDLSHIFERDVEFAPSHHISPSEAVDVAVPPVLTEAAVALSIAADGDPITSRDLAALALDAEYDAVAGSGWSSPVVPPSAVAHGQPPPLVHQGQSQDKQQHPLSHVYANASRSPTRGSRSFSPDSGSGGRAASPESSTFSVGTPPTSAGGGSPPPPPASLGGPFSQRLAEALENEASKPGLGAPFLGAARATSPESVGGGGGGGGTGAAGNSAPSSPPVPHVAAQAQQARSTSHSSASFTSALRPSHLMPFPAGSHAGSDDPFSSSSPLHSPSHELGANPVAAPHPRKLSFASYADLVNEERLAELTGERLADVPSGGAGGAATPGASGLPGTASPMGGRSRSGTKTGPHALGLLHVEQLEGKLAAATLEA